jgi:hypothetical protein
VGNLSAYFNSLFVVEGPTGADPISSTVWDKHSLSTQLGSPIDSESARLSKKSMCLDTKGQIIFLISTGAVEEEGVVVAVE